MIRLLSDIVPLQHFDKIIIVKLIKTMYCKVSKTFVPFCE